MNEAGPGFPGRDGGRVTELRALNPSCWPVVRDKALALELCREEFPERQKAVKQVKSAVEGKEYGTCGQTHGWTHTQEESHPRGSLNGAFIYLFFLMGHLKMRHFSHFT